MASTESLPSGLLAQYSRRMCAPWLRDSRSVAVTPFQPSLPPFSLSTVRHFEALPQCRAGDAHGSHVLGELRKPSRRAAQQARGGSEVGRVNEPDRV